MGRRRRLCRFASSALCNVLTWLELELVLRDHAHGVGHVVDAHAHLSPRVVLDSGGGAGCAALLHGCGIRRPAHAALLDGHVRSRRYTYGQPCTRVAAPIPWSAHLFAVRDGVCRGNPGAANHRGPGDYLAALSRFEGAGSIATGATGSVAP